MNTIVAIRPAYLDKERSAAYCAISESTLEKGVRNDTFPKPRQLAGRKVGWLVKELDAWAESRPVSELPPPENCQFGRAGKAALSGA